MVKIIVRFDDICPTMNWEQWSRAESLLSAYNVKPLIGVIPDSKDLDLKIDAPKVDFWSWVKTKQQEGYAIAMHGYEHVFCSPHHGILNRRMESEFAGLSYEEQFEKIRKGKEILNSHGIDTDIFFSPAHSYDENTVRALAANGFRYVSDGKSSKSYIWHGVKFLPCRNTGHAIIKGGGWYTSIFHAHEWVNKKKSHSYDKLKKSLEEYQGCFVSFEEYKRQECSSTILMRFEERLYTWLQYSVYHRLKNILKR